MTHMSTWPARRGGPAPGARRGRGSGERMSTIGPLAPEVVEQIGAVLGDTTEGLTGGQIAKLLARCGLPDPGPITKRDRITEALLAEQRRTASGAPVVMLVKVAMNPARWV